MGNAESHQDECNIDDKDTIQHNKKFFYDKYNWIPSHPGYEYEVLTKNILSRKFEIDDKIPGYVDLRNSFPNILSIESLPINPIVSVVYLLHYHLLKNRLPIFPPSALYIYRNMEFYRNVHSLFNFETIFNSVKKNGFCSENEFPTNETNLSSKIDIRIQEKACAFKFIEVYRVNQDLETIKILLKNEHPILIGFSVYYDLSSIDSYMWMPDKDEDTKIGGLTGVIVGYIDERKMFIMATTFGKNYGTNGYVMIPYEYVLSDKLTGEMYILDFRRERVEGYITQRKEMVNLQHDIQTKQTNKKVYEKDSFGNLFK